MRLFIFFVLALISCASHADFDYPIDSYQVIEWYMDVDLVPGTYSQECIQTGCNIEWGVQGVQKPTVAEVQAQRTPWKREALGADIDAQVPDSTVRDNVRDNGREADISRYWGAAADKAVELQNTADADLDAFDPTLDVAPASNGKGYARFTVSIKSTSGGDYSIEMVLKIEGDYEDQGADARATIVDAPLGSGATLPFTQDAGDSQIWRITPDYLKTNFGYSWADSELPATLELRWGSGSLVVSPRLTTKRLDDRKAALVRYGVASEASSRRRR